MTPDQRYCIEALAFWANGKHHLPKVQEWGNGICINHHGDLSSYDFDRLTRLVIVAHAFAVRIEISWSGPRLVRIIAHRRHHGDRKQQHSWQHHPDLDDLTKAVEAAKQWRLEP